MNRPRKPNESYGHYRSNPKKEQRRLDARLRGRRMYNSSQTHERITHGERAIERKPARAIQGEDGRTYYV